MRDAHRRFRDGLRLGLGWTLGCCLKTAWAAAKMRRDMEQPARAGYLDSVGGITSGRVFAVEKIGFCRSAKETES